MLIPGFVLAQTPPPPAPAGPPSASPTAAPTGLPSLVVTASPIASSLNDLAQPVTVLDEAKLRQSLAPTLGETLGREPGVSSSSYGPNASRPVIRGLDGDHIRLLQNGVGTMDVSGASVDHAVSQDPLTFTRIEVVRGPAALLYGPTAVGGVVNVLDNRIPAQRSDRLLSGQVEGRLTSQDSGRSGAMVLEGGRGGWNYHFDAFARDSDDLAIPDYARSWRLRQIDPLPPGQDEENGHLGNSQARSSGGAGGLSYVWDNAYLGGSFQDYGNLYGTVAEKDVMIDMRQRRWDLAGAAYDPVEALSSVKWKFAASDYTHTELEAGAPGTVFQLNALNGRVEATHRPLGSFEGTLGYEVRRDELAVTGNEAFLPPTDSWAHSLFLFEERKWDQLRWQVGGRLDHSLVEAAAAPGFGPAQSRTFTTGSASTGVVYRPFENYSGALNLAHTRRAPVNQELFANGPHLATEAFEVGDSTLGPERSWGTDLTLRKEKGAVTASASIFHNRFENFITLTPRGATDPTYGLPIFDYQGVPAAFVGGETSVLFHFVEEPDRKLGLELKADYVEAANPRTDQPLPRIPPWRLGAELTWDFQPFGFSLGVTHALAQDKTAPNELPTDGHTLLDTAATYRLTSGKVTWDLLLKGTNLLDEEVRLHTSFLKDVAPLGGRGATLSLRATF